MEVIQWQSGIENAAGTESEERQMVSMGLWEEPADSQQSEARTATAGEIMQLIKSQNYRCALTGVELTPDVAAVDHKRARSQGGSDSIENLQVVHAIVNRMKNTMTIDELIEWCRLITQHSNGSYRDEN